MKNSLKIKVNWKLKHLVSLHGLQLQAKAGMVEDPVTFIYPIAFCMAMRREKIEDLA